MAKSAKDAASIAEKGDAAASAAVSMCLPLRLSQFYDFFSFSNLTRPLQCNIYYGRPHAGDMVANGQIQMMVITSSGDALDQVDGLKLRRMALAYKVPVITTISGALAI